MAFKITADTSDFGRLSRDFYKSILEANLAARASTRAGAEAILKDAQGHARFSTRIPTSGHIRAVRGGWEVVFGGDAAPDAAPIENRGKGYVSHPVFGRADLVTSKGSHPAFLQPAIDRFRPTAPKTVGSPIVDAIARTLKP